VLINEAYQLLNQFANKNEIGGYLPPNEFSRYSKFAQIDIINELYDILDFNLDSSVLIGDVIRAATATVNPNGYVNMPADYYKYVSGEALYFVGSEAMFSPLEWVKQTELPSRIDSAIVKPTKRRPAITADIVGLKVYPQNLTGVAMNYLVKPPDPVWAAVDPNVVPPVFDPLTSVDFILSHKFLNVIVYKLCVYFSIEIKDQDLRGSTVRGVIKQMQQ
jgi:hypothetical protein